MGGATEPSPVGLEDIGKKLEAPGLAKDQLLKLLKQASTALAEIRQLAGVEVPSAIKPCAKALGQPQLLKHRDKDVKLLTAACLSEVLRIHAPEPPYDDDVLKGVFRLFITVFKGLDDTASPSFPRRFGILESLVTVKSCVVMLDLEDEQLLLDFFQALFDAAREQHPPAVVQTMVDVMTILVNESEDIKQPLMDTILANLLKPKKDEHRAAYKLALDVLDRCSDKFEGPVQHFLLAAINGRPPESEVKDDYHNLILELYLAAPSMLMAVLPSLQQELQVEHVEHRVKVVDLVGSIFLAPGHQAVQDYKSLFEEFLARFRDKDSEVRSKMVDWAKQFLLASPADNQAADILKEVVERALDFDDKVRLSACTAACEVLNAQPKLASQEVIKTLAERLRDKKPSVRKETCKMLIQTFRQHCLRAQDRRAVKEELFASIPRSIVRLCYDKDFKTQQVDVMLDEELFPPKLPASERARYWVTIYGTFDENDRRALSLILSLKRRAQKEMEKYLDLREQLKANPDDQDLQNKMNTTCTNLANCFVDSGKALESLKALSHLKDNRVFKAISQLLDPNLNLTAAQVKKEDLLKTLTPKHALHDFVKVLASKLAYTLFGKDHVTWILQAVQSPEHANSNDFKGAAMSLLTEIAGHFPQLLEESVEDLSRLLGAEDERLQDGAALVIEKAGTCMKKHVNDDSASPVQATLLKLAVEGDRKQAKHAVGALAAVSADPESGPLATLYTDLLDNLDKDNPRLPVVLQSLGCIAQYAIDLFETREDDIIRFVIKNLLKHRMPEDNAQKKFDWEKPSGRCLLQVYGLKALVKSFLPTKPTGTRPKLKGLLNMLIKLLPAGQLSPDLHNRETDRAHVRLAAAKGVIALAQQHDPELQPELFHMAVLTAQDMYCEVRQAVLEKVHKLLHKRAVPARWATVFAVGVVDIDKDNATQAQKYLREWVEATRKESRAKTPLGGQQGSTLRLHPEYGLVYLLHTLAHHPDFPDDEEKAVAEDYEPFQEILTAFLRMVLASESESAAKKDDGDNLPAIYEILRTLKASRSAFKQERTKSIRVVCDIGLVITKELTRKRPNLPGPYPGQVELPKGFFAPPEDQEGPTIETGEDGSDLPNCLRDQDLQRPKPGKGHNQASGPSRHTAKEPVKVEKAVLTEGEDGEAADSAMLVEDEKGKVVDVLQPTAPPPKKKQQLPRSTPAHKPAKPSTPKPKEAKAGALANNSKPKPTVKVDKAKNTGKKATTPTRPRSASKSAAEDLPPKKAAGGEAIGKRVKVWWPQDKKFYTGAIKSFDKKKGKHKVVYDDGDEELLNMAKQVWDYTDDPLAKSEDTEEERSSDDEELPVAKVSPRKRGRPKKSETTPTEKGATPKEKGEKSTGKGKRKAEGDEENQPMRKRGRPPKEVKEDKEEDEEEEEEEDEETGGQASAKGEARAKRARSEGGDEEPEQKRRKGTTGTSKDDRKETKESSKKARNAESEDEETPKPNTPAAVFDWGEEDELAQGSNAEAEVKPKAQEEEEEEHKEEDQAANEAKEQEEDKGKEEKSSESVRPKRGRKPSRKVSEQREAEGVKISKEAAGVQEADEAAEDDEPTTTIRSRKRRVGY